MTPKFIHELMCNCRWQLLTATAHGYDVGDIYYRITFVYNLETSAGLYNPYDCNYLIVNGWISKSESLTDHLVEFGMRVKGWTDDCRKIKSFDALWDEEACKGVFKIHRLTDGFTEDDLEHHFMMARLQARGKGIK